MQTFDNGGRQETRWHVLHVRPRCEKKMAAFCAAMPVEHYLPLRREAKKYQRRTVEVWKPLFPGYVFVRFRPEEKTTVLQSGHAVRVLEVGNQALFIGEIEQIRQALKAEPGLSACPALAAGMTVRITSGPFQGLEGTVLSTKGPAAAKPLRVVINVSMIGQGVAIEAYGDMLERL